MEVPFGTNPIFVLPLIMFLAALVLPSFACFVERYAVQAL